MNEKMPWMIKSSPPLLYVVDWLYVALANEEKDDDGCIRK